MMVVFKDFFTVTPFQNLPLLFKTGLMMGDS